MNQNKNPLAICTFCYRPLAPSDTLQVCTTCEAWHIRVTLADLTKSQKQIAARLGIEPHSLAMSVTPLDSRRELMLVVGYDPSQEIGVNQLAIIENRSRQHLLNLLRWGNYEGAYQRDKGRKEWVIPRSAVVLHRRLHIVQGDKKE